MTRFLVSIALGLILLCVIGAWKTSEQTEGSVALSGAITLNGPAQIGGSGNVQNNAETTTFTPKRTTFVGINIPQPIALDAAWSFTNGKDTLVSIRRDGSVVVNPQYSTDDAARAFWAAVLRLDKGSICEKILSDARS